MRALAFGGACIVFCLAPGCGERKTEQVSEVASEIQGGLTDVKDTYAVGVCAGLAAGQCQLLCSGALIAPNLVMTARHCTQFAPEPIDCNTSYFGADIAPASNYFITTNPYLGIVKGYHNVTKIVRASGAKVCGN